MNGLHLIVDLDLDALTRALPGFAEQVPYATSRALNAVAWRAVQYVREQLPQHFTIRSRWVERGIRKTRATKRNLELEIGSRDPYMELQQTGGTKTPPPQKHLVSIPVGARKTKTSRTTPGKWPARMLQRPKYFIAPRRKGSDIKALWRRKGKKRYPILLQWVFRETAQVPKRWRLPEEVAEIFEAFWVEEAQSAFEDAVRTAKPKKR